MRAYPKPRRLITSTRTSAPNARAVPKGERVHARRTVCLRKHFAARSGRRISDILTGTASKRGTHGYCGPRIDTFPGPNSPRVATTLKRKQLSNPGGGESCLRFQTTASGAFNDIPHVHAALEQPTSSPSGEDRPSGTPRTNAATPVIWCCRHTQDGAQPRQGLTCI